MNGEILKPRKIGPYLVCDCVGEEKVESIAKKTQDNSQECNRVCLNNTIVSTLGGGERYIICALKPPERFDASLLPKFIGAVQARIGRLYNPDGSDRGIDEMGEELDQIINSFHGESFYKTILHQPIPGDHHLLLVGMTRDHKENYKPDRYFIEFTSSVSSILIGLFSKTAEETMYG